jgi:hypothetical protein
MPQGARGAVGINGTMANVLNCLPKSAQPGAKAELAEIYNAEDSEHAVTAVTACEAAYGAKWPKAVAKITDDLDVLLAFYDYPATTAYTCARLIPLSRPSPPCAFASGSPRDQAPGPPGWRWRPSSSSPHRPGGAPSTHPTLCHSCEQEPRSTRGNSSNDRTTKEVTRRSPEEISSTGLDHFSTKRPQDLLTFSYGLPSHMGCGWGHGPNRHGD